MLGLSLASWYWSVRRGMPVRRETSAIESSVMVDSQSWNVMPS